LLFEGALVGDVLPAREDEGLSTQFHPARRDAHDADIAIFAPNPRFQAVDLPLARKLGVHRLTLFRVDPQPDLGWLCPTSSASG